MTLNTIIGVQTTETDPLNVVEEEIRALAQRHGLNVISLSSERNDEIAELRRQLQAANAEIERYKTNFANLASMSHEIRTPLGTILGNSEMLLTHESEGIPLKQDESEYLKNINNAGKDLLDLINDFIDFNRIQIGKLQLYLEAFDVHSLIEFINTIGLMKKTTLTLDVSSADVGMMYSDPVRVQQVLITVLKTAIRLAAPESSIGLDITRHVEPGNDSVLFHIHCQRNPLRKMDWVFQRGIRWPLMEQLCQLMAGDIRRMSDGDHLEFFIRLPAELEKPSDPR